MKITQNKELDFAVSWICNELKKEILVNSENVEIKYILQDKEEPSLEDQRRGFKQLLKEGVVSSIDNIYMPSMLEIVAETVHARPVGFKIKLDTSKLDEKLTEIIKNNTPNKSLPRNVKKDVLYFNVDGRVRFNCEHKEYKDTEITYSLLFVLNDEKNKRLSGDMLVSLCDKVLGSNGKIHNFQQLATALGTLKTALKVGENGSFPIRRSNNTLIWDTK
jgi:hypothetical protein